MAQTGAAGLELDPTIRWPRQDGCARRGSSAPSSSTGGLQRGHRLAVVRWCGGRRELLLAAPDWRLNR
jgi:hypothetical protein